MRALYDAVDETLRAAHPIDDLWDEATGRFRPRAPVRVTRATTDVDPDAGDALPAAPRLVAIFKLKCGKVARYACASPRVGCLLYKLHVEEERRAPGASREEIKARILAMPGWPAPPAPPAATVPPPRRGVARRWWALSVTALRRAWRDARRTGVAASASLPGASTDASLSCASTTDAPPTSAAVLNPSVAQIRAATRRL